jgi:hypothetical protein
VTTEVLPVEGAGDGEGPHMDSARMGVIRRMNMMHFMVVEMREAVDTGPDTSTQGARVRRCLSVALSWRK